MVQFNKLGFVFRKFMNELTPYKISFSRLFQGCLLLRSAHLNSRPRGLGMIRRSAVLSHNIRNRYQNLPDTRLYKVLWGFAKQAAQLLFEYLPIELNRKRINRMIGAHPQSGRILKRSVSG
jgi:hypothetical protein